MSSAKSRVRNSALHIKITLSPSQVAAVTMWAARLNRSTLPRMDQVTVLGCELHANAYDLTEVLRVADERESNEFDLFRLKTAAIRSIEESMQRRKNPVTIRNLKIALSDLKRTRVGDLTDTDLRARDHQQEQEVDDFSEVVH